MFGLFKKKQPIVAGQVYAMKQDNPFHPPWIAKVIDVKILNGETFVKADIRQINMPPDWPSASNDTRSEKEFRRQFPDLLPKV